MVSNLRVLESRVAAAYAKLALLENSRRLARFRELRQRNECLSSSTSRTRPAFEPSSDPLAVSEVQDSTVSLRFVPLPGDVMTTSSNITSSNLAYNQVPQRDLRSKSRRIIRSTFSAVLHQDHRAHLAIAELCQQLLDERTSHGRLRAAALVAGLRSTNTAKHLAQKFRNRAVSERLMSQQDTLQEARES